MTAPMDQLADLVAGRLLREAVTDLVERPRTALRDNAVPLIRQLFADSHLEELWERAQLAVPEPDPLPRGGKAIEQALGERLTDMQRLLSDLQSIADRQAASMADRFAPRPAIDKLLQSVDPSSPNASSEASRTATNRSPGSASSACSTAAPAPRSARRA